MSDIPARLLNAIRADAPQVVRIVGNSPLAEQLRAHLRDEAPPEAKQLDLAILVLDSTHGQADPEESDIAMTRDVLATRCLAWVIDASSWPDDELRALGFTPVADALWGYNIADYKPVPDWLNPRHWANPELWDKHRW